MKRELLFNLIIVSLSCFVGLLISEGILRLFKPVQLVGVSHQPCIYEKDEKNGYRYIPNITGWIHRNFEMDNIVVLNEDGFHDVKRNNGKKSDFRILAIGDSFTAATHVPTLHTWTQVLEKQLLNNGQVSVEVINLGLDGTGTDVHANILSSYLKLKTVDIVILAFNYNDVHNISRYRTYREIYDGNVISYQNDEQRKKIIKYIHDNKPSSLTRHLFEKFYVLRAVMKITNSAPLLYTNYINPEMVGISKLKYDDKETTARMVSIFYELIRMSQRERFQLIVVPVPRKTQLHASMNALVKILPPDILEKLNITNIVPTIKDLLRDEGLDYHQLYWKYDGHFNSTGNRIFGTALARILIQDFHITEKVSYMQPHYQNH